MYDGERSVDVGGVHFRPRTSSMMLRRVAGGGESLEAGRLGDEDGECVLSGDAVALCALATLMAFRAPHGPTTDADAVDSSSAGNNPSNCSSEMHVRSSFSSSAASVGSKPRQQNAPRHQTETGEQTTKRHIHLSRLTRMRVEASMILHSGWDSEEIRRAWHWADMAYRDRWG
jgi:hypothetical protein